MITRIVIVPEDDASVPVEEQESFAVRDQNGTHLSDADNLLTAIKRAREIAVAAHLEQVTLNLYPD